MLKSAALLHLRILQDSVEAGWILKDSTPYNIQFVGSNAIFIDLPSFEPWVEGDAWVGYRQFVSTFLTPLMMRSYLGVDHLPITRSYMDGIPPMEAQKFFKGWSKYRKGVMSHIVFPARVETKILTNERDAVPAEKRDGGRTSKKMLLGLIDSLLRIVRNLSLDLGHTDWSNYDSTHTYVDAEQKLKMDFVESSVEGQGLNSVWDIGCNTGTYSRIAAKHAKYVLAVDGDHNAIEKLYQAQRKEKSLKILPIVVNLSNISPDQGWVGRERRAFDKRNKPQMVFALALVHHIRMSANIPLDMFLDWLRSLNSDVVIEFVCRHDEMVIKLLTNKVEQYEDYSLERFEAQVAERFTVVNREALKG